MSGPPAGEPTLADVQREHPGWECARGVNGFCYAEHTATGTEVNGEDPVDLRDQIKAGGTLLIIVVPEDEEVAATHFGAGVQPEENRPRLSLGGEPSK